MSANATRVALLQRAMDAQEELRLAISDIETVLEIKDDDAACDLLAKAVRELQIDYPFKVTARDWDDLESKITK